MIRAHILLSFNNYLKSDLNKFSFFFQTIDDENLKQLNDEQLFKLLEEAYHSKKLDEKNKSAIFKVVNNIFINYVDNTLLLRKYFDYFF